MPPLVQRCFPAIAKALVVTVLFRAETWMHPVQASDANATIPVASKLWKQDIVPLFDAECVKCHGPLRKKGGLDLTSFQGVIRGGDSGTVIAPGSPQTSLLFQFLQPGADPHMPPKRQLTPAQIDSVAQWITHVTPTTEPDASPHPEPAASTPLATHASPALPSFDAEDPRPISKIIDHFIRHEWTKRDLSPAPRIDDRTFVRRVYLDLIGRLPSPSEVSHHLFSGEANKRSALIQELLATEAFGRHMRESFDILFLGRKGSGKHSERANHQWHAFLEEAFNHNRPWDAVLRDVILARQDETEHPGALWFLYEHKNNHQAMAESLAPMVFGTQIKCAQCHDHPLAHEIKQAHYWGMVAAFNRSKNVNTDAGIGIAESAIGGFINFANLEQESQPAILSFLNGVRIDEQRPEPDTKEADTPTKYVIAPAAKKETPQRAAIPKFSRREQLANAVTRENPLLAQAAVNQVWALLMGRGLVHPVDEINSKHPPSHPELLDWLARALEHRNYDLKWLIAGIANSEAYQLHSSQTQAHANNPDAFATGLEKPLKGETLYRIFLTASGHDITTYSADFPDQSKALRELFVERFPELLPVTHQATLQQAMFLTNSNEIDHLLQARPGNAAHRLAQIADPMERIQETFLALLGRYPDAEEATTFEAYVNQRSDRPDAAQKQIMWTLLSSAEFLMNH